MKKITAIKKIIFSVMFLGTIGTQAYAQFSLSGEVRPRMELRHGYSTLTDKDTDPAGFASQRTRLNFNYSNDKIKLGATIQDVFIWGDQPQLASTSNTVMFHTAWGQYYFTDKFSVKLGRQELVYDDQRIFGNSNWDQQGRSHDLMLLKYEGKVLVDVGLAFNQSEARLNGTYYDISNNYKMMQYLWFNTKIINDMHLSLLFLNNGYEYNYTNIVDNQIVTKSKNVFNQTIGGRLLYSPDKWMFHLSSYYTMGKDTADRDLSAYYFGAGANRQISKDWDVGVGWEMLSGTSQKDKIDNPKGYENHSFNTFYTTAHKFNGYMDYFNANSNWGNSVGLNDVFAQVQFGKKNIELNLTGHLFWSAATIIKKGTISDEMNNFLGTELDLTFSYKLSLNSYVTIGYSQMFGTETLEDMKGGDYEAFNNWAYVMFTFKPNFIK